MPKKDDYCIIVVEGIDGAGKSLYARMIALYFEERANIDDVDVGKILVSNFPRYEIIDPTNGEAKDFIDYIDAPENNLRDKILKRKSEQGIYNKIKDMFKAPSHTIPNYFLNKAQDISHKNNLDVLAGFFYVCANLMHRPIINYMYQKDDFDILIMDRYPLYTSFVYLDHYAGAFSKVINKVLSEDIKMGIIELVSGARLPDIYVALDVASNIAYKRINAMGRLNKRQDSHETEENLGKIRAVYQRLTELTKQKDVFVIEADTGLLDDRLSEKENIERVVKEVGEKIYQKIKG
ncbi:MAG: hypothetical protein K0B07_05235 [DPANN group archaeon]|nr:hypothetical protein [DPANN group archaeon]